MIKSIEIKNFKALKEAKFELSNLNVLTGLNGMGKSSLIQVLLLLKQSDLEIGNLRLDKDDFISLGKGRDVYYQYGKSPFIEFSIKTNDDQYFEWKFEYMADKQHLRTETDIYTIETLKALNFRTTNFQYLNAERVGPRATYKTSSFNIESLKQIGNQGEFAAHFLNVYGSSKKVKYKQLLHPKTNADNLIKQVDAWLGEISPGTKLNTTVVPGTEIVLLDYQFETDKEYTNRFRPVNVGFGISYILPVILALLCADENRMIIIENPEAHLHPRGQAEMGKLISLAASTGAQIIIETHSDHIINGIRVATKNQNVNHQNVRLFFFDRVTVDYEQYTTVSPIKFDKNGELSDYPKNFMDEWNNQLFKLI